MLDRNELAVLWRHADPAWLDAFAAGHQEWAARWGLGPNHMRHFLAQCSAETGGLRTDGRLGAPVAGMCENFNYSPARIKQVFSYRLKLARKRQEFRDLSTDELCRLLANDDRMFAEVVYGNRPELGNTRPGDGWKFRGRGPLQNTGRYMAEIVERELGVSVVENPDLLSQPDIGWQAAFVEWHHSGCNALADTGSCEAVSRRINGGTNGLAERQAWLRRVEAWWPSDEDLEEARRAEQATFDDLRKVSRKAAVVDTAGKVLGATATAGATIKVAADALPPAKAPTLLETTDTLEAAKKGVDAASGLGKALADLAAFVNANGLLVLIVGAVLAMVGVWLVKRWMTQDVQSGRYRPSGTAPAAGGDQ